MDLGRVWLRMPATALVLAAGLLGCSTPATTPELTLGALEVYGPSGVTIGFTVGLSDTGIAYHGELERLDGEDSGTVWAEELAPPVDTMGTIGLGALDGSTPTVLSTRYEPGAPLQIASSCQVKAAAIDEAGNSSTVAAWSYTLPGPALVAMRAFAPDP